MADLLAAGDGGGVHRPGGRTPPLSLAEREILVNAVAPGPVWPPLIPSSFSADEMARFGGKVPLARPGQPG
jgi:NAD(P)-dependent dehydrogenase (short-subunit alcohol dehydrogenase family)